MDDVITLVKETVTGHDEDGNEIKETTERQVFCQVFGVDRREFYQAATAGLHPDMSVRLSDYLDYEGEQLAVYEGSTYTIVRAYRDRGSMRHGRASKWSGLDPNGIELILQRRIGND